MLISFNFTNYKSFKNRTEFSLEPLTSNGSDCNIIETGYKKSSQVFRTSAIFGANASGKSNFVEAFNIIRSLVTSSYTNSTTSSLAIYPYKLSGKPGNSCYETEFIKNNVAYRYIVELNSSEIIREEVYYTELAEDKREKCLFKRTLNEFASPYGLDRNIAEQTIKTRLLVSELVNNRNTGDKLILDIYNWFAKDLCIMKNTHSLAAILNNDNLNYIPAFLNKADINISKLTVREGQVYTVVKDEDNKEVLFNIDTETSMGTKTLIILSGFIKDVLENGKILVIDELDNSLHPHLVKYLVGLFNNPETNTKGAQLIFTSHAHYLMDGESLTRDQIWFVAKDNGYSSELYSLSDFKQIKRKKGAFYNEYMYGIFGAVPNIRED